MMRRTVAILVVLTIAALGAALAQSPPGGYTTPATVSQVSIQQGGVAQGAANTLNCSTNVTCTVSNGLATVTASATASTAFSSLTPSTNSTAGTFAASGNVWDFSAATSFKTPVAAGAAPSVSGLVAYDSTANKWVFGQNGSTVSFGQPGSCTNQFVTATSATAVPSCASVTAATIAGGAVGAAALASQYSKVRCQAGLGDGLNAMAAGTYLETTCYNDSGVTWTITRIGCFTDNAGTSTLNATNGAGTGLLTGAVTCTTAAGGAAGTQSATVTIANNDVVKFTFVADGASKQTSWFVSFTQ